MARDASASSVAPRSAASLRLTMSRMPSSFCSANMPRASRGPSLPSMPGPPSSSPARTWARAIERTASIVSRPNRTLPVVIDEIAERSVDRPALLSDREQLSYRELADRAHRHARWALDRGLRKGDVVGLLMPNRPEYVAIWLGLSSVGVAVALLNTHLTGRPLAHAIEIVHPAHIIVADSLANSLAPANLGAEWKVWTHDTLDIDRYEGGSLNQNERPQITIEERALYIYTSGTTGLSKAATVSHARVMQWSQWFAGLMDAGP